MSRRIRYKEPTEALNRMSVPNAVPSNRASIGMDNFLGEYYFISVDKLIPFKNQARTHFDEDELNQLSQTIKVHGIRQPLTIVKSETEGKFEVVSGERRLRAAKLAGLEKIPCIILDSAAQKDEIAIIENIQRSDLHPIELARGLKKLIDSFGWGGQTEIQNRLGIPTNRISEAIRLLDLSVPIQDLIIEKNFSGREKLLKVLKLENDEEREKYILGQSNSKTNKEDFSVIRVRIADGEFKIQKNSIKLLSDQQKVILKDHLLSIIDEL